MVYMIYMAYIFKIFKVLPNQYTLGSLLHPHDKITSYLIRIIGN
jgi:hypothetical protein